LIKAACRAGVPEDALQLLSNGEKVNLSPSLGGIHYLMINFSLKGNTEGVLAAFALCKKLPQPPNTRTYHILIRECIDNNLLDEAMNFATSAKEQNITLNRVTYNTLMNGLRKRGQAQKILDLKQEMDQFSVEINETTIKFVSLAHIMLGETEKAIHAFIQYPELNTNLDGFLQKYLELIQEDETHLKIVLDLFTALTGKIVLQKDLDSMPVLLKNIKTNLHLNM